MLIEDWSWIYNMKTGKIDFETWITVIIENTRNLWNLGNYWKYKKSTAVEIFPPIFFNHYQQFQIIAHMFSIFNYQCFQINFCWFHSTVFVSIKQPRKVCALKVKSAYESMDSHMYKKWFDIRHTEYDKPAIRILLNFPTTISRPTTEYYSISIKK